MFWKRLGNFPLELSFLLSNDVNQMRTNKSQGNPREVQCSAPCPTPGRTGGARPGRIVYCGFRGGSYPLNCAWTLAVPAACITPALWKQAASIIQTKRVIWEPAVGDTPKDTFHVLLLTTCCHARIISFVKLTPTTGQIPRCTTPGSPG